ncbi:MAG: peptidase M16C associated domain-containing protein [Gammaproteobacteria bacterium]|nr:MAG: peptidase M16C associated domain-containing protein [Gammaproteobacteria bacterium]TND04413.1 MAG: peptidase M16C associated domain-containing protein [Gammaproteobacteria bacterium]
MTSASVNRTVSATARPGTLHPAFELRHRTPVDSLHLVVEEYRHRKTGALHFHLAADNTENAFLVALRTIPTDSTGVAHILEHTALCGSERYPVRDPFFMMIRRSLNTFMNAMTSSDWTAYPFASQNRKDFWNLTDVYLDAVFFSRLEELDFAQEGHRIEFEKPDDSDSNLVFKGIVFNEMKGAMSSPVSTLWQELSKHLFPTTTYHFNSGGDPRHIPDLSYAQLKEFYRVHYHPSNAVFMTYGDIPAYEHQEKFENLALSRFEALDRVINVSDEQRFSAPLNVEERYALDESEATGDKTHIVIGWLLGRSISLEEQLKAHLMSGILLNDSASPLRHALETTKLGAAPSPLCGLEDSSREMVFVCGLEGSKPEHAAKLEKLIFEVLHDVATNGVPQERIEAILHQLELDQREIGGDSYPYGLQLILDALPTAIHRGDPVATLNLDPILEQLREDIRDPNYIKNVVRDYLIKNTHRVRLTLAPDTGLADERAREEAARLAAIRGQLNAAEKKQLIQRAQALQARQQRQDDPDVLPKVGLNDIPPHMHIPAGETEQIGATPVTFFDQGTNGLVYQQIVVDLPDLEDDLLEVAGLYTACLTEVGVGDRDYLATQAWQSSVSGGVYAYSTVRGMMDDEQKVAGYFVLSGKALARNHDRLTDLLRQTFERVRFDEGDRIREIIAQMRTRREASVTGHGQSLAMLAATSGMSPSAALAHQLRGLTGIQALKKLDDGIRQPTALKDLIARFGRIHQRIVAAKRQFLMIGEAERHAQFRTDLADGWRGMEPAATDFLPFSLPTARARVLQAWLTSTQVNFSARAFPAVPAAHPDAAALTVLGGFLRNGYLHRAIREQGGAYGGGASYDSESASFRFYSYRDPRLIETLADFDRSIDWLRDTTHEWRQLEEAILGVISSIDKPGSPAGEAKEAFHNTLIGRTPELRERFRERITNVTLDDLKRVAATYLKPENASTAIITSAATLKKTGDLGLQVHHI